MAATFVRALFGGNKASVADTMAAINTAAAGTGFSCKTVSWEDAQRASVDGNVSSWGPNISDVRLYEKSGNSSDSSSRGGGASSQNTLLFTVRSDNWNERLGFTTSDKIAVVTSGTPTSPPRSVTLRDFLKQIGTHAAYAGMTSPRDLSDDQLDQKVSLRFQTVFLPVGADNKTEFCTEVYNYQTRDNADPRNLLLLCTPQSVSIQHDGSGAQKLFFHAVDPVDKTVHRYWLEAEMTSHKVGSAQAETQAEAEDAARRGKATATFIGTEAMGKRFNIQMLVQVPLKQKPRVNARSTNNTAYAMYTCSSMSKGVRLSDECDDAEEYGAFKTAAPGALLLPLVDLCGVLQGGPMLECCSFSPQSMTLQARAMSAPRGVSSAARVSRGTEYDVWRGLTKTDPERDAAQHITITVTTYNVVNGGVPTVDDVKAAIADLDALYKSCDSTSRLSEQSLPELTVSTMLGIAEKIQTQPYTPPSTPAAYTAAASTTFPISTFTGV